MNQSDDFGKILKLWPNLVDHYKAMDVKGRDISRMEGVRLKEVLNTKGKKRSFIDSDVKWDAYHSRLVAIWYAAEKRYLCWLTDLPSRQFTSEDISKLYRLRWQIELLFKEWKSHNNLRRFATCQSYLVEGLIWSSLLSLLVKRYLCRAATTKAMLRLSLFKMAKTPADGLSQS